MNPWHAHPVPAMRHEALHRDRVVRCFAARPAGLHAMFERARSSRGTDEALVHEGRRWSYAEAGSEADRLAAGFASRGVGAGDRILMLLSNRPEFCFVLLALQRLGAIAVPVGIREPRPGLAFIAGQCGATGIVFDDALADRVPLAQEAPSLTLRLAASDLAALGSSDEAVPAAADRQETDTAVILYTSGTTGRPKGAMLTHLAIAHSALHFEACMRLGADDRSALAVPASHVTGLIAVIATMWHVGGAVVLVPEFKAEPFVQLLARERITHTLLVPAMYRLCLMSETFGREDLTRWRIGGYGGAPMPEATIAALAERLPRLTLLNAYGATETTSPATLMPHGPARGHADSVGVPCPVLGERVHADVYAPGSAADDAGIRAHCATMLADYKVPETITWRSEPLPRNANGKVMKRLLRAR